MKTPPMKHIINRMKTSMLRKTMICFLFLWIFQPVLAQDSTEVDKTKFIGKIGHWLQAYGISGDEFMQVNRNKFKASAFAEVYIQALIDHDSWMFNMLNRVTTVRYEVQQTPHILFQIKFKPTDDNLNKYTAKLLVQPSREVSVNLQKIVDEVSAKYLANKQLSDPGEWAVPIENALSDVLNVLAAKLGKELAPNILVRYKNEVFWNGHEIPILAEEGNSIELEAIDKNGALLNPANITWTNADPFRSKGVVDLTGVNSKSVTLAEKGNDPPLTVTVKRANSSDDIKDMLKELIIEALAAKKQQALDTIPILKQDSATNAANLMAQIALLERGNYPLENVGVRPVGLFSAPPAVSDADSIAFVTSEVRKNGFVHLRKHKRIRNLIRRKVNVVALANLIVDQPEKITILLDGLMLNSGRLLARLILNRDSQGKRDAARNIVVDFLNENLERIAGNHFGHALLDIPLPSPPAVTASSPAFVFSPEEPLYVSPMVAFEGKETFVTEMKAYLLTLEPRVYVAVNYSQDINSNSFINRVQGTRPRGIPEGHRYVAITLINIPGSIEYQFVAASSDALLSGSELVAQNVRVGLEQILKTNALFSPYQYLFSGNLVPGPFSNYAASSGQGFSFISPAGKLITVPATVSEVSFSSNGLLAAFTIPENGKLERYVGAEYVPSTNVFAGYRKSFDAVQSAANENIYKDLLSKSIGGATSRIRVFLGLPEAQGPNSDCGIYLFESTYPVTIGTTPIEVTEGWNSGGNRSADVDNSVIAGMLNASGGTSSNPIYGAKIKKINLPVIKDHNACEICANGKEIVDQSAGSAKSDAEYQALIAIAKVMCGFEGDEMLNAFNEEVNLQMKVILNKYMLPSTAYAITEARKNFWHRPDAWQLHLKHLNEFVALYNKVKNNASLRGVLPNSKIKAIINARSSEFLNLFSVKERASLLKDLLPEAMTSLGLPTLAEVYVSEGEENAIIKILKSIQTQVEAKEMLEELSKADIIDQLNIHIDDVGLGGNNYTALSNEFRRLTLLMFYINNKTEERQYVNSHLNDMYSMIWNDNNLFFPKNENGIVRYHEVSLDRTRLKIIYDETKNCRTVTSGSANCMGCYPYTTTICDHTPEATLNLDYFEPVLITVANDFSGQLPEQVTSDCARGLLTYAGFLDYLNRKQGSAQIIQVVDATLTTASLAFGVGELVLIVRAGATVGRVSIVAWQLGSEMIDATMKTDAFLTWCQQHPNECAIVKTGNLINQLAALGTGGFDLVRNWDNIKTVKRSADELLIALRRKFPETDLRLWNNFMADFKDNMAMLNRFHLEDGLVDSWKAIPDLPPGIRKDLVILQKGDELLKEGFSASQFRTLATLEDSKALDLAKKIRNSNNVPFDKITNIIDNAYILGPDAVSDINKIANGPGELLNYSKLDVILRDAVNSQLGIKHGANLTINDAGNRIKAGGKIEVENGHADLEDLTSTESIQHKLISGSGTTSVSDQLLSATRQLRGTNGEVPTQPIKIAYVKIVNASQSEANLSRGELLETLRLWKNAPVNYAGVTKVIIENSTGKHIFDVAAEILN